MEYGNSRRPEHPEIGAHWSLPARLDWFPESWGKRRDIVDEVVLLIAQSVDLRGGKVFRPTREKRVIAVEGLLAISRPAQWPYQEAIVNVQGPFKGVAQGDMVAGIGYPVAFGGDADIMHEGRRGTARHCVCGKVPHTHGNGVILIEIFPGEKPEELVPD